jgi:hypothetical protein
LASLSGSTPPSEEFSTALVHYCTIAHAKPLTKLILRVSEEYLGKF